MHEMQKAGRDKGRQRVKDEEWVHNDEGEMSKVRNNRLLHDGKEEIILTCDFCFWNLISAQQSGD
jgi:hypothetical protein